MIKFSNTNTRKEKSFTLIELLVVIAIIGLLSAIVLVSLNGARQRAKDAKTKAEFNQIVLAMRTYYTVNESYPSSDGTWKCLKPSGNCWYGAYPGDTNITNALSPYMSNIPLTQSKSGCYFYDSYLYNSGWQYGSYPTGPYIIWAKESGPFQAGECQGYSAGNYDCGYYYCYQYIGM